MRTLVPLTITVTCEALGHTRVLAIGLESSINIRDRLRRIVLEGGKGCAERRRIDSASPIASPAGDIKKYVARYLPIEPQRPGRRREAGLYRLSDDLAVRLGA